jgi:large subunit ribosomal protein L4
MTTVDVVTAENQKAGSVELSTAIFEAPVKPDLFHAEVCRQLAKRRAGTHSTRNRAAVSGGGSKPWRQKGTGRARQGTTRAPQWAGGGVAFGPVPRSYEQSLPKKMRRAALRGALSLRREEGAITVVEEIEFPEIKTRRVAEMLSALSLEGAGVLIVIDAANEKLERSARNLRNVGLVITRAALSAIEGRLGADRRRRGADSGEVAP